MINLGRLVGIFGVLIGIVVGFQTGTKPLYVGLFLVAPVLIAFFFNSFEIAVLGLLILRSALDPFSEKGVTGAFAIGLSALTIIYVVTRLLAKQKVEIDGFWWFFAGWVALQGVWVILLPLGGSELGVERLPEAMREWVRVSSWVMCYLLTLQLKDRLPPEKFINRLFLALIVPLTAALLQLIIPAHFLPSFLAVNQGQQDSRINGTLGLSNTFATFLIFFIGLTYWKITNTKQRLPWVMLMILLVFFLVSTKVLIGIAMLVVLIAALVLPRLNFANLVAALVLISLMFGLFSSTEFGRGRLASIAETPLFNSQIDASRAVLLAASDNNSFNWRIAQWTSLVGHWQHAPVLGYGLQTSNSFGPMFAWAHNDYIRVLVEEGFTGLALYLSFFGVQFVRLFQLIRSPFTTLSQKRFCSVLVAFLLAAMVGMLTENIWSHTTLFFYWFALLAIADWNWEKLPIEATSKPEARLAHFR